MGVSERLLQAREDCKQRGCTREYVQGFIDRTQAYWSGNAGIQVLVESLKMELEGMV